jgi:hypothetical protein
VENGFIPKAPVAMSYLHSDPRSRAQQYLTDATIQGGLGSGIDGIVYQTSKSTAIKVHGSKVGYFKELRAYQRLLAHDIDAVAGFSVPRLLNYSDELAIIELTIVQPPCVIDFVSTYVDQPPDFTDEVWEQWKRNKKEEFGDKWDEAAKVFYALRKSCSIYYMDLSPRNVLFPGDG